MEETIYYLEAANGEIMRVPESKLEEFQALDERLNSGSGGEEKVSQKEPQALTENKSAIS